MYLLSSIGLSTPRVYTRIQAIIVEKVVRSVAIIVNSSVQKSRNKYFILARKQLESMGIIQVKYFDLESENVEELKAFDMIYIPGGNTFLLLQVIEDNNLFFALQKILSEKIVIGVSAGALLLTPTIRIANEIEPDEYLTVKSMDGLTLVDFEVYPHYTQEVEKEIQAYEAKYKVTVRRITDTDFIEIP